MVQDSGHSQRLCDKKLHGQASHRNHGLCAVPAVHVRGGTSRARLTTGTLCQHATAGPHSESCT